jgi:predicted RNA binding protein YcfA (HicA-like mRNA interferase family)
MGRFEKLLRQFLENPGSVKYKRIEKMLLKLGCKKIEAKGSHKKFKHRLLERGFTVAIHGRECRKVYKYKLAKIIKKILYEEKNNTFSYGE